MARKPAVVLFSFLIICQTVAFAQDACTSTTTSGCFGDEYAASFLAQHPGSVCTLGPREGGVSCHLHSLCVYSASCASTPQTPTAAAQETAATCSGCIAGSPINLVNGNTFIEQTDVSIPGLGGGLRLARRWNSLWPQSQSAVTTGMFGAHWRSTYEESLLLSSDGTIKYAREDGSFWSLTATHSGWVAVAPANESVLLTGGTNTWQLKFKNGEVRIFDPVRGFLLSIIDRNGNATQLSYDTMNRLVSVADPAGRHLYFGYGDSSYLVTSVTSDVGLTLSYAYDDQGRITSLTRADHSTLSFEYDSNSFITAVKDSNGKILEAHSYDARGRGLSSSRANGVEALTVTYPVR